MQVGQAWRPPDTGWIKINTDGALSSDTRTGGAGGVARSHLCFLGAWSKPLYGVTDPLISELLAVREGTIFAQLRGFSHVVIETDCLEVVNLWSSRGNCRSVVAPILQEVEELSSGFMSFSVQHVSRLFNNPAHLCAKRACTLSRTDSWVEACPEFLVSSLLGDCKTILLK